MRFSRPFASVRHVSRIRRSTRLVALLTAAVAGAAPAPASPADLTDARAQAVRWAVTQAGHKERGTTNCSSRITRWEKDMGLKVPPCRPWCGAIVHQAFLRAGIRLSARLIDPDRSYGDAVAGRRGLRAIPVSQVRKGDLLFFKFRRGLRASHLAIVRSTPRGGKARTVEGNVEHTVKLKTRGLRYAVLAARVTG